MVFTNPQYIADERRLRIYSTDITERIQANWNRALNADLERRVRNALANSKPPTRNWSPFSYSVSHDLRAPLRHN